MNECNMENTICCCKHENFIISPCPYIDNRYPERSLLFRCLNCTLAIHLDNLTGGFKEGVLHINKSTKVCIQGKQK